MSTPTTVQVKIQLRRDTSANWASVNPVLLAGEMGLETNTNRIKLGDGTTAWNNLGYFPFVISGGTVTGNLEIGTTGTLTFEGSSADNFETTLGVINPTADRTINLPNVSGTIITTGDTGTVTSTMIADGTIVNADVSASAAIAHSKLANITAGYVLIGNASNVPTATQVTGDVTISDTGVTAISSGAIVDADVSASAEIAVSKLADGAARQLLQTDAAGTGVEWTSNVDIPGTLDVTGAATFDGAVTVAGDLTVNGTTTTISTQNLLVEDKNIIIGDVATPTDTTADGGGITLKGTTDKTINWVDATDAWTSSERFSVPLGSAASPSLTFTSDPNTGLYSPGADQLAISTNSVGRLFVDANGRISVGGTTVTDSNLLNIQGSTATHNVGVVFNKTNGTPQVWGIQNGGSLNFFNYTASSTALTIDTSNRVGVGTSSPSNTAGFGQQVEIAGTLPCLTLNQNNVGFTTRKYSLAVNASGDFGIWDNTASAYRMYVDSSGRVGVGTTSVSELLHVSGTGDVKIKAATTSTGTGANAGLSLDASTEGNWLIQTGNAVSDGLRFYDVQASSERLRIDSSGRVGIGTSAPGSRLTVNRVNFADASATGATTLSNAGITVEAATDTNNRLMFGIGSTGGAPWIQAQNTSSNATQSLILNPVGGNVGIGYATPGHLLDVNGDVAVGIGAANGNNYNFRVRAGTTGLSRFIAADTSDAGYIDYDHNLNSWIFRTNSSEAFRVDSSQRLLVGTSSARTNVFADLTTALTPAHQVETAVNSSWSTGLSIINNSSSGFAPVLTLGLSCANSVGSNTLVPNGNTLGRINFAGNDGTNFVCGARIAGETDGATGSGDLPSRLVFSTTADGASSPTERMRIRSNGSVYIGSDPANGAFFGTGTQFSNAGGITASVSGGSVAFINRQTNDGTLIDFAQDQVTEGTISVSGTTVSYNGAHLSRWSQLPFGVERTEILRGSVLSNIDEMCEWGEEDNEQLNRMKVSDVEGDKNVSGVFQAWDDDDDTYTNDFYCAMTGDFIIRIGAGVTVERGDLLMSAGDGTAKPQDDDIIRSKTIAKVTSTNVSCTYDDGSYCVPCVLMAC